MIVLEAQLQRLYNRPHEAIEENPDFLLSPTAVATAAILSLLRLQTGSGPPWGFTASFDIHLPAANFPGVRNAYHLVECRADTCRTPRSSRPFNVSSKLSEGVIEDRDRHCPRLSLNSGPSATTFKPTEMSSRVNPGDIYSTSFNYPAAKSVEDAM